MAARRKARNQLAVSNAESPNLDLLRALAVGFVVLSHIPHFVSWVPAGYSMDSLGHLGVGIFFVHTTLVLLMSLERSGAGTGPFLVRRAFRIFPLSMSIVLLIAGLQWMGGPVDGAAVLSNLLLLQHVTGHKSIPDPLWTLPYEVLMYLFLPAVYAITRLARATLRVWLLYSACLAVALFAWAYLREFPFLGFVPCFLPGAIAFVAGRSAQPDLPPWVLGAVVVAFALAIPTLAAAGAPEVPLLWVMCLALGLVIPRCRAVTNRATARVAHTVATYSYGIYLTHVLALGLAFPSPGATTLPQWVILAVMLPALAMVVYHWIEKPGIRLGVRLARRWPSSIAPVRVAGQ